MPRVLAIAAVVTAMLSGAAQGQSYGVPNPAACVDDGNLWYNDASKIMTYNVAAKTYATVGTGSISPFDMAWGADGVLYGVSSNGLFNINPTTGASTQINTISSPLQSINGLGGLPDGRLLLSGQVTSYTNFSATTSKIYTVKPTGGGSALTATVWADLSTFGSYSATGDNVVLNGAVYSLMRASDGLYLFKIPIDSNNNPITSQISKTLISGATYMYGLASYGGKLYGVRADYVNGSTSYNQVYELQLTTSATGALTGATLTQGSNALYTATDTNTIYSLTARPEPWGGFCPPPPPVLNIAKTNNVTTLQAGSQTTYQITVTNASGGPTTGSIAVRELLPTGVTFVSATSSNGTVTGGAAGSAGAQNFTITPATPLAVGQSLTLSLTANVTSAAGYSITNKATVGGGGGAVTTPPDPATCTAATATCAVDTDSVTQAALQCQTSMYGLTPRTTGGTDFLDVRTFSTTGAAGPDVVWAVPATSGLSATLGISPDGKYLFAADGTNGVVYWRDVTTGNSGSFNLLNYVAGTDPRLLRMSIAKNGIGYITNANKYWTFNTNTMPNPTVAGSYPLVSDNPAADTTGNGDLVSSQTATFLYKSPGNLGQIDIFKISGTTGTTALYYGRITDSRLAAQFGGAAALGTNIYLASSNGTLASIDMTTLTVTSSTTTATPVSDLASCSYPDLSPQVTTVKSATVLDSAGNPITRSPQAGDLIEYSIVTRNSGTLNAANTTLQDAIPAGTTYVAGTTQLNTVAVADVNGAMPFATASSINSPGAAAGVLEVDTTPGTTTSSGTDPDDNEAVVTFRVRINAGTTTVSNQASVVHVDGSATSNTVTTNTGAPALTVAKSVDTSYVKVTPDPSNTGTAPLPGSQLAPQTIRYTITVTNSGTATASNVQVTDTLPAGLTFVSATLATSAATGTYGTPAPVTNGGTGQNLVFNVGTLSATEPGKSAQIVVTATVNVNANTTQSALLNTAAATATGVSQVSSNQVRTDIIYPKITKALRNVTRGETSFVNSNGGYPSNILEYCIDFRNYSSTPIQSFVITDNVPLNTTALLDAYGAGQSVRISRSVPPASPVVSYQNTLTTTGGLGSGTVTANLGTLAVGEQGQVCFQARIK